MMLTESLLAEADRLSQRVIGQFKEGASLTSKLSVFRQLEALFLETDSME